VQQNTNDTFPRELTQREYDWLLTALPENKIGYKKYRDLVENLVVIGCGRFGAGNLVLGEEDDVVDLEDPSAPIFAIANISYQNANIYVTIHEMFENQIEVDIKSVNGEIIPDDLGTAIVWTYSNWVPGDKAPHDNTPVREIAIVKNELILVFAPIHKKVWVYNSKSGINHFIPVTNYYNELMILMGNKDPETALDPGRIFTNLDEFSNQQLIDGFLIYNKRWHRIELDPQLLNKKPDEKKKSFFGFFKK
jgi:hypothetical protein